MGCLLSAVDRDTWPSPKELLLLFLERPSADRHLKTSRRCDCVSFLRALFTQEWGGHKAALYGVVKTDKWPASASRASLLPPCVCFPVAGGNNSCLKIALPPGWHQQYLSWRGWKQRQILTLLGENHIWWLVALNELGCILPTCELFLC